ncbi:hypothetical protein ACFYV7_13950 [Nocardia suismassiliense]|uniref:Antitoxin FitA-like ribbon-helix-helix domain-containing protein n=1 Tax=Nocardia suismassiliense TaxID=2077092 RepID=A0ABW6QRN4_9NOCA
MVTVLIRDIPDEVAEVLRRRAAAAGMSLAAYVRSELMALARQARRRDQVEAWEQHS